MSKKGNTTVENPTVPDKDPEKSVDLPPYGKRNPDPITDSPGSHPIETGVGAAIGGAASGLAVGAVGGPIGAAIGAMVGGAVAGGLAGKGIGELIDPTTEDNWIRDYFRENKTDPADQPRHTAAYRFGVQSAQRHQHRSFDESEQTLRQEWAQLHSDWEWEHARPVASRGFDRMRSYRPM